MPVSVLGVKIEGTEFSGVTLPEMTRRYLCLVASGHTPWSQKKLKKP
jgi:hypothetical protein